MWTVNKKSEECVTLHSDVLEMFYELNINMKCVALLLLGNVKNFLIPLVHRVQHKKRQGTFRACGHSPFLCIPNLADLPRPTPMLPHGRKTKWPATAISIYG